MRILLVEDDKVLLEKLQQTLLEQRYIVDTAVDGQTAWDYAQSTSYDLLLMGIKLPKLDGITISQRLRQKLKTAGAVVGWIENSYGLGYRLKLPELRSIENYKSETYELSSQRAA